MCGIAGYIGKEKIEPERISRTLDLMKNRGPDNRAYVALSDSGNNIYLLHSRLSIIDLSIHANQPFSTGDCTLIFNGEIYNYIELRKELKCQGHHCLTNSDTEVLLRSYLLWGEKCVKHFEGMWSFAIFDKRTRCLFLSRDRFGEKPLYYLKTDQGIYFASEIRFIKSLLDRKLQINQNHVFRYLINGYKSLYKTKETYYQDLEELRYAQNMVINADLKIDKTKYWSLKYKPQQMSMSDAIEGVRHYLNESVKLRLRADVPLAFCLSGGVDSAALASIASKEFNFDVSTFTIIDQDERYNEYYNVKATIDDLGCKHTLIKLDYKNTIEKLINLIEYYDAPVPTLSSLAHSFLCQELSKNGYKVAIAGTSADELFTGYYDHFNLHLYEMYGNVRYPEYLKEWKENIGRFVRNPYLKNPQLYMENVSERRHVYLNNEEFATFLKIDFKEEFSEEKFCDCLLRNRMLNELFHEATPVLLHREDLNAMKYSVENRSPYLDSRLCDFVYFIPNEHLIYNGYSKYVLREAVRGVLNDTVRLDRRKIGFNASISSVIDFKDKKIREFMLDDSPCYKFIKRDKIESLLDMYPLPNSYSKFLFNFINVKVFLDTRS